MKMQNDNETPKSTWNRSSTLEPEVLARCNASMQLAVQEVMEKMAAKHQAETIILHLTDSQVEVLRDTIAKAVAAAVQEIVAAAKQA
jgi:rhamnogalacturonyl hydrolase YesR